MSGSPPDGERRRSLRRGFSTGACAAAAARAAYAALLGRLSDASVPVVFPNGETFRFKLEKSSQSRASASVVKDAGDDPDVTDKALISATLSKISPSEVSEKDYVIEDGEGVLVLRGGEGVGLATRAGLAADKGKWAINPVPRSMILENLKAEGFGSAPLRLLVLLEVADGAELAKRTLNPTLGVLGGISILGTSGFVEPYSNAAYVDTIKVMVSGAKAAGAGRVVLCTGGSTLKAAMKLHPDLPEVAFIRIADFIEDALLAAAKASFRRVVLSCMEGKLLKYASGLSNTHAWKNAMDLTGLTPFLLDAGVPEPEAAKAVSCPSVREAMAGLEMERRMAILNAMSAKAIGNFREWTPSLDVEIDVFDPDASPLLRFNAGDV